jgi:pimeloyl-ACP methyl ester carboxylesterase
MAFHHRQCLNLILALACSGWLESLHAQAVLAPKVNIRSSTDLSAEPCNETATPPALKEAFRLVCAREPAVMASRRERNIIIVGFVGGFVKPDDPTHPEVLFASYLKRRYGPAAQTAVFANHDGKQAVHDIMQLLDQDHDGSLSAAEKQQAEIIVFGHSWGGSQTVTVAEELGQRGIPVALTIQIDSVRKPGQHDRRIPANVAKAVNFYESQSLTPGESQIVAADATRTNILGNFHMKYDDHPINCDNYKWLPRVFNRPHHEIENDPRVWNQIASLIDLELLGRDSLPDPTHVVGMLQVRSSRQISSH